jgi:hypothetical protein
MLNQEQLYDLADRLAELAGDFTITAYRGSSEVDGRSLADDADVLVAASVVLVAHADGWR